MQIRDTNTYTKEAYRGAHGKQGERLKNEQRKYVYIFGSKTATLSEELFSSCPTLQEVLTGTKIDYTDEHSQ